MKKKLMVVLAALAMLIALSGAASAYCGNWTSDDYGNNSDGLCVNYDNCNHHSKHHQNHHGHYHSHHCGYAF